MPNAASRLFPRNPFLYITFPTLEEVRAAIPAGGIAPQAPSQIVKKRMTDKSDNSSALVWAIGKQDQMTKLLMQLPKGCEASSGLDVTPSFVFTNRF